MGPAVFLLWAGVFWLLRSVLLAQLRKLALKTKTNFDDILIELMGLYSVWDEWDNVGFFMSWGTPEYGEYIKAAEERAIIRALEYFNKWKCPNDQVFFCVSFGDDDGVFGSLCEHGGIFKNVHHVQISHH